MKRCTVSRWALGPALLGALGAYGADPAALESFETQVRPILATHCYPCHGPEKQKAGLRLDHISTIAVGGDNGPALVAGDVENSRLIHAIRYDDVDLQMPPRGKLSDDDIAALTAWVEAGAVWPDEPIPKDSPATGTFDLEGRRDAHWAWQPVSDPPIPDTADTDWPRNDIDRFLLARLEKEGLQPASPADDATWLRRVYFDLTGLPPSPDDVNAFLANPSEDKHGAVVDQLLASPRFGEHWGRHWLDLTRYAETHGQEQDFPIAEAWRYRDYVIRAFNEDVPYDQLVREHIAGDLLPKPRLNPADGTNESIIATGFWFMYQAQHAPVDVRKDYADRIDNEIDVFSKAFLGMTVSCARCHDHKFDAISTADYYALAGILRSSRRQYVELDPGSMRRTAARSLAEQKGMGSGAIVESWQTALRGPKRGAIIAASATEKEVEQIQRWLEAIRRAPVTDPATSPPAASLAYADFAEGFGDWQPSGYAFGSRPTGPGAWLAADGKPVVLPSGVAHSAVISTALTGALRSPTFRLGHTHVQFHAAGKGSQIRLVIDGYHIREHHPLLFESTVLTVDHGDEMRWLEMTQGLDKYQGCEAYIELLDEGNGYIAVDAVRFADAPLSQEAPISLWERVKDSVESMSLTERLATAVDAWANGRASADDAALMNAVGGGSILPVAAANALTTCKTVEESLPAPVRALAMADGNGHPTPLLIRGNAKDEGEPVPRHFLTAIDGKPLDTAACGRAELADAVLSVDNPLTARVAVNRIWYHLFGQGLVPSLDNFGVLGQPPSHPDLLDHLATEFRRGGWSQKAVIRELVLSSAYRMSSHSDDAAADEKDPANALLHRMNVRRLPAESVRDAVLAASGTLNETMYGPSVPAYISPFMGGHRKPGKSGPMDGDLRRSVYLEVRRNFLSAFLMAFDFPAPDTAHGLRNVSNVPAQALILMNDPFVAEQAQSWGARLAADSQPVSNRLDAMYLAALGRHPDGDELERMSGFFAQQAPVYGLSAEEAVADGRIWADLCHVLFTVKEFVYLG